MKGIEAGNALIVGGSGALGMEVIRVLAARGLTTFATYCRNRPKASTKNTTWIEFNILNTNSGQEIYETISRNSAPLNVIIYAAGISSSKSPVINTSPSEFVELFTINAIGLARVWQLIAPLARASRARIVAIGSDTTRTISSRNGAYSASKAALETLVMTLAKEEAEHGVRFNLVAPSLIASPLADHVIKKKGPVGSAEYYAHLPWGRALSISEVAHAVVDVAVQESWAYATGQIFRIAAPIGQKG